MPLSSWDSAFSSLSLASGGDGIEKEAVRLGIISSFPNYERLWKLHVAPATLRPVDIQLRPSASNAVCSLASLSHAILGDISSAAETLEKVRSGDFGSTYGNPLDAMSADGNALQKFTNIQSAIKNLGSELGSPLVLWSKSDWDTDWGPRRQKWIFYRNNLTHSWRPFVAIKAGSPYVIHPDYLKENMPWHAQEALLLSSPNSGIKLGDVCDLVHRESIAWLNDAYGAVISLLAPLRFDPKYQRLWGWDLSKRGAAAWQTVPLPQALAAPSWGTSLTPHISGLKETP